MTEIRNQRALRFFGSLLAFTHLLTAYFWLDASWGNIGHFVDAYPMCWPYLPGCGAWGRLTINQLFAICFVYSSIAAAAGVLFLIPRRSVFAFWLLAAATLIKLGMFHLDYRLSGNYHYMHFWVLAAFLLFPAKALTIRFLIVAFYVGAGVLKLNKEWLTGAAIWENPYLNGVWLRVGCVYVVILELILVFGLLSRHRQIFWLTLAQLLVFHAVSFLIVGYYYPLMFVTFLSIFVLTERGARFEDLPNLSRGFLALFVVAQAVPFVLGRDRAVDGRGRLFALSMFDANARCEFKATAKFKDRQSVDLLRQYNLEPRLNCDPHVLLTDAKYRCRQFASATGFLDLDISLRSKRKTDADYTPVFEFVDFCTKPHHVDVWGIIR